MKKTSDYLKAVTFTENYEPRADRDYDWVLSQALHIFDHIVLRTDKLDDKAEFTLRYLAPTAGLVNLVVAWFAKSSENTVAAAWLIALGGMALLVCMACAVKCLSPKSYGEPPGVADILKWYDEMEKSAAQAVKAVVAAAIDEATLHRLNMLHSKGLWLRAAYVSLIVGIALFTSGIAAAVLLGGKAF